MGVGGQTRARVNTFHVSGSQHREISKNEYTDNTQINGIGLLHGGASRVR